VVEEASAQIKIGGVPGEGELDGMEEVGDDGLLDAPAGFQAEKPGSEGTVLQRNGGPGVLDERGLEPVIAIADSGAATLPGTLRHPRAETGPGDEMAHGVDAAHVRVDLRADHSGGSGSDAWDGA